MVTSRWTWFSLYWETFNKDRTLVLWCNVSV